MDSLREILRTQGNTNPLLNNAQDQLAVFRLWQEVAGKQFSKNAVPARFYDGVLEVVVSSSVWANQLDLFAPEIIKKINQALGEARIEKIKFRVGKIKAPEERKREDGKEKEKSGKGSENNGGEQEKTAEEILNSILRRRQKTEEQQRARGLVACLVCGGLHPKGEGDYCRSCRGRAAQETKNKILRLVRKAPWISFGEAATEVPGVCHGEFSKVKREEAARLKDETEKLLREIKGEKKDSARHKKLISKLKDTAYGVVMLRSGKSPGELDDKMLKSYLSERIRAPLYSA
jgi:hypothetical protein